MTTDAPPANLEDAYESYRGLHLRVLGRLAREGFHVQLSDTWDVVHDFYADAYGRLVQKYDSRKGPFTAYLYGAFYRFARRWVLRGWREDRYLSALRIDGDFEMAAPDIPEWTGAELASVDRLLSDLTPTQREFLRHYLEAGSSSLRAVARTYGVSKRQARDQILEAIARIAAQLERPLDTPEEDWAIIERLWREGRSERQTAMDLGLTRTQVRIAKERFFTALRARLPSAKSKQVTKERP